MLLSVVMMVQLLITASSTIAVSHNPEKLQEPRVIFRGFWELWSNANYQGLYEQECTITLSTAQALV